MIRLLKFFVIVLSLAIGILITGAAFLQFADLNPYRSRIETIASRALSRQFQISGPMEIKLFPNPELILNDVKIANTTWGSEPEMLTVGHLEVSVGFLSLFSDMIIIRWARLSDVTILLEQNEDQRGNWTMGESDPVKNDGQQGPEDESTETDLKRTIHLPLMADLVELKNISLTKRSPGLTDKVVHIESLRWEPDRNGNIQVGATGEMLGNTMNLDAVITSLDSIKKMGPVRMEMETSVGDIGLKGELTTSRLKTLSDFEGDFHFSAKDLQKTFSKVDMKFPFPGPVNVDLNANHNPPGFDLSVTAKLQGMEAKGSATVSDTTIKEGNIKLHVDEIGDLLKTFKAELPITGPLSADLIISADKSAYKGALNAKVDGFGAKVSGFYKDSRLTIDSTLSPVRRLGEWFSFQGLSQKALLVKADVGSVENEKYDIKSFQANVDEHQLSLSGTISPKTSSSFFITMKSPNLQSFLDTLPAVACDTKAKMAYDAEKISVTDLNAKIDKSDLKGDLSLSFGGRKAIKANLTSKLLDLRPFFDPSSDGAEKASSQAEAVGDGTTEPGTDRRYVFKQKPLQLEGLQQLEVDAEISVGHFLFHTFEFNNLVIDSSVHDGHMAAKAKLKTINEGTAAAKIDLKANNNSAELDTVVSISDLRIGAFENEGVRRSEAPPVSISLELASSGRSPRELASGANGRILLTQGSGRVANNALDKLSGDILSQLFQSVNPFSKTDPYTNWDCSVISIRVVDGLAEITNLLAQGEKVMIVGGGDVDLKTERINIEFNTKPREGIGISADMFVTPFIGLEGTLASPRIGLNKKGTLITGSAAVATAGLSIVAQTAIKRATAAMDLCEKTKEHAGRHIQFSF